MEAYKRQFLDKASLAAEQCGHIFPTMVACEAALESGFGTSKLAIADNNLLGMKQHSHPVYGTHNLPTKEFVGIARDTQDGVPDGWITIMAAWITYPGWKECFDDRMATLRRLAPQKGFEHYAAALVALDPSVYVREVSAKWSTDPNRPNKVIAIFNDYLRN